MTRRPGDTESEPPGGRAAERLREFLAQRFPGGIPPSKGNHEADVDNSTQRNQEYDSANRERRQSQ
jgi:hypothetical protein